VCWCYGVKHSFSLHKDTTPPQPNHTVTPTHIEPEQYKTWNKSTISRKLLKMDVLTFETCWAVNSEIINQVTSSWSIFIQLQLHVVMTKCCNLYRCCKPLSVTVLHKKLPLVSVLSQTVQLTLSQPVSFIYILYYPSTPRFSNPSLSCRFLYQKFLYATAFPHKRHNRRQSSPRSDHPNYIWWEVSILHPVIVQYPHSTFGPNTLLSAIFSINSSSHSLLNANDQRFTAHSKQAQL